MIGRLLFLALFLPWMTAARAEYLVERGDVLAIVIGEDPKLGREAKVNADGQIILPVIGGVQAAGSGLGAIADRVRHELMTRDIIRAPTVVVDVTSYRPFYVGGAVARPGAVPFEPGLTVRHAIVLAGGMKAADDANPLTASEILSLRAKWRSTQYRVMEIDSRIARIKAELEHSPDLKVEALDARFVPQGDAQAILSLDAGLLRSRIQEQSASQLHGTDLSRLIDFELEVLAKQASHQEKEQSLQQAEVENARTLLNKGYIPLPRVQELERENSRLSRDLLENQAFAARARQNKANLRYELESVEAKRRMDAQRELRDATLERAQLKTEATVLVGNLMAAGLSIGDDGNVNRPTESVVIYRPDKSGTETLQAAMETEIRPGDIVSVTLSGKPPGSMRVSSVP